ncbi:putative NAD(P)H nitroreductase [Novipirellula galeiformis]|uniref:Putative NAD(P)H nitroreductase n=1 Tax=Novipirellula galeiformis TaxID=2528004 RepID=A0A5C6CE15_9BACT|nr:nitroreductase family protein [Novipirellula galeiformis]TWU22265.1 putative NAD(P)H nitroreductase [Novipirellula galeiformis]
MSTESTSQTTLIGRLRNAVGQAVQAPSNYNTQPWLFRIMKDGVELMADRRRACPVVDPEQRELLISCGAALYHLRLAMKFDGLATLVRILPDPANPNRLARVLVAGSHETCDDERMLFEAIPKRRTNRFPFEPREVDPALQAEWIDDAKAEHVGLHFASTSQGKHAIADLVSEGDRLQASDRHFRRELAKWSHSNHSWRRDGLPAYTHGASNFASNFDSFMVRTFDWGAEQAAKDRQLAEGSPLLALISTSTDMPADWIACGQALGKILLRAAAWSVDASFMNQPIELPSLRPKLAKLMRSDQHPQVLMRLGYGIEVQPTPRRRLDDVIMNDC